MAKVGDIRTWDYQRYYRYVDGYRHAGRVPRMRYRAELVRQGILVRKAKVSA